MADNARIVIGLMCLSLFACDEDLINDLINEEFVNVYQDDQALSCSTEGIVSIETHSELLSNENIEIQCSQKGNDGFNYIQSCGAETGSINIFTISDKDLSKAESLGFSNLSDFPDAQYDDLCGSSSDSNSKVVTIEDFEQQIRGVAGTTATDCGKVDINDSSLATNTCVSDSFVINAPFYSFYVIQGVDASVAYGISMDADGVVEYWSYDSLSDGKIYSSVCKNATATFNLTGSHTDIFNCIE